MPSPYTHKNTYSANGKRIGRPPKKKGTTVRDKIVQHKKYKAKRYAMEAEVFGKGTNQYTRLAVAVCKLPPFNPGIPELLQERIDKYFELCERYELPPSLKGFCNAINHMKVAQLKAILNGKGPKYIGPECIELLQMGYDICEEVMQGRLQSWEKNPAGMIFLSKNMFGYTDTQKVQVEQRQPLGELEGKEALAAAARMLPPVDVIDGVSMVVEPNKLVEQVPAKEAVIVENQPKEQSEKP